MRFHRIATATATATTAFQTLHSNSSTLRRVSSTAAASGGHYHYQQSALSAVPSFPFSEVAALTPVSAFSAPSSLVTAAAAVGENAAAATTTTAITSTTTFEPILPDATALLGFGSIAIICAIAAWVWANQVVPVSRTKLALSKKKGPVKDYLDELRAAASDTKNEFTVEQHASLIKDDTQMVPMASTESPAVSTTEATTSSSLSEQQNNISSSGSSSSSRDRSFEQWLFTDWLEKAPSQGGRQKEPALPVLKDAKWNSGDNPVLAATALIMGGVILTSAMERVASFIG
mmetsp:Transcript_14026/g.18279  ORF Transcript_14026/g.18279 Transcript_14026/m.18279 type:complete len:289 (+) Transcript_14026:291-1157(+)|eukprot:CAMPEP_0198146234 /NCGR_PEP_ID=MMETSP1443-20131203/28267_1 /TAXON_ID=186043 /ORGANISM="Entomoneis sp., Strain CCMP2396" /LENGTH=288 /DNA_ID=CAMNT_0043810123 /DNA_START=280 /DNA_END=1146 /DNA_ORIENTATION=-